MKTLSRLITAAICILAISCGKDGSEGYIKEIDDSPDSISVSFLKNASSYEGNVPRFTANLNDEWQFIELQPSKDNPKIVTLLCLGKNGIGYLVSGGEFGMLITEYNPVNNVSSSEAVIVNRLSDTKLLCSKGQINLNNGSISTEESLTLNVSSVAATKASTDEQAIRQTFYNMFAQIGGRADAAGLLFPNPILTAWSNLIVPIAQYKLYEDDPELQKDLFKDLRNGLFIGLAVDKLNDVLKGTYGVYEWFTAGGNNPLEQYIPSAETVNGVVERLSTAFQKSVQFFSIASTFEYSEPSFKVGLTTKDVYTNSIYCKGICEGNGTGLGYALYEIGGGSTWYDDTGFKGMSIESLKSVTSYTVYAKAIAGDGSGKIVSSEGFTFTTVGFELTVSNWGFTAEGGTCGVGVKYSDADLTSWEIIGKPSWCSIEKGKHTFFIDVGETSESRSGTIEVLGHSKALGDIVKEILVSQSFGDWDGTTWKFSGKYTVTVTASGISTVSSSEDDSFGLAIESVSANRFTLTGGWSGFGGRIYNDGNYLVWESTEISQGVSFNQKMKITRTGARTASAKLTGTMNASQSGVSASIKLSGSYSGEKTN